MLLVGGPEDGIFRFVRHHRGILGQCNTTRGRREKKPVTQTAAVCDYAYGQNASIVSVNFNRIKGVPWNEIHRTPVHASDR